MINDFIIGFISLVDNFLYNLNFFTFLSDLITKMNTYTNYVSTFQTYLSSAYFIFGKPLVMYVVGFSITIFAIKVIGAIVMIVGQFIP